MKKKESMCNDQISMNSEKWKLKTDKQLKEI